MDNQNWQQDFKKMDLTEQGTFFVLGAIDTVFNTLTNTFNAVAEVSQNFADFTSPDGAEKFGVRSLESVLGWGLKTDKINRPETSTAETAATPTVSKAIPIKPAPKKENGNGGA
jgi:hypothetical protein